MTPILRRLWWATLPYYGWIGYDGEDGEDGAVPPPWYAYPLALLHRLIAVALRGRDVFGPRHNAVGPVGAKPWQ